MYWGGSIRSSDEALVRGLTVTSVSEPENWIFHKLPQLFYSPECLMARERCVAKEIQQYVNFVISG